ncbi:MAG: hypothetical protein HYV63_10345 [Candidatus Schekmanbacteria bacterium]|nr:hypothetical protein [Candidatus Schekmanbacteria bacterium]
MAATASTTEMGAAPGRPRHGQEAIGVAPGHGVDYRITGFWRWRTVVVPPNAYVVHTRRGKEKPLHLGIGMSFPYNPFTDAFLVIPAAMQTIIINANCICAERQGVLVQAYVQWIVHDLETAYRRLDFSDPEDPMRVVNVQLREQAEAAIKDKVATMGIDEVLSDKQPIIEELTLRLRSVAEGNRDVPDGRPSGLGLKIVTVQIKEAVVSSTTLWENLQKPFRVQREQVARLAELEKERLIGARQLQDRRDREQAELQTAAVIEQLRAEQERERWSRETQEKQRRQKLEQEALRVAERERADTAIAQREQELRQALEALALERRRIDGELSAAELRRAGQASGQELQRQARQGELDLDDMAAAAELERERRRVEAFRLRRAVENDLSAAHLHELLLQHLPEIASALPAPRELRALSITGDESAAALRPLLGLFAGIAELLEGNGRGRAPAAANETGASGD